MFAGKLCSYIDHDYPTENTMRQADFYLAIEFA